MSDLLALIIIIFWPVIPLFWIPIHGATQLFKRLGLFSYIIPLITWLPLAYVLYKNKALLLNFKIGLPTIMNVAGIPLLIMGIFLHIWAGWVLGLWGLIGLPEISHCIKGKLVTEGPFFFFRHPVYLAHSSMFFGIFLLTEVITTGIVTVVDFLLVHFLIIPMEEIELLTRFGEEYKRYKDKVPKLFPWVHSY